MILVLPLNVCKQLEESGSGSINERDIWNRFSGNPDGVVVPANFVSISGVNQLVARAFDSVTRRRELPNLGDSGFGIGTL